MSYFHVGQKVIACEETGRDPDYRGELYVVGHIYTISNIYRTDDDDGNALMLELKEVFSPDTEMFWAGFEAECFDPVVETDISIFNRMLTPTEKVDA